MDNDIVLETEQPNDAHSPIFVMEDVLTDAIFNHLHSCDADTLAHIAEVCFGGSCSAVAGQYEFTPDEGYTGVFNNIET